MNIWRHSIPFVVAVSCISLLGCSAARHDSARSTEQDPITAAQQRLAPDMITAFEGDSSALRRVEAAITPNDTIASRVAIYALGQIHDAMLVGVLENAVAACKNHADSSYFVGELERWRRIEKSPSVPPQVYQFENSRQTLQLAQLTDHQIDSVIRSIIAGVRRGKGWIRAREQFRSDLKTAPSDVYERTRKLLLKYVDSLFVDSIPPDKWTLGTLLMTPAAGEMTNIPDDVREVFEAMRTNGISGRSVSDSASRNTSYAHPESMSIAAKFPKGEILVLDSSLAFLAEQYKDYACLIDTNRSVQRFTNRHGPIHFVWLRIQTYRGFGGIGITYGTAYPYWIFFGGLDGYGKGCSIRKIDGRWWIWGPVNHSIS